MNEKINGTGAETMLITRCWYAHKAFHSQCRAFLVELPPAASYYFFLPFYLLVLIPIAFSRQWLMGKIWVQ